MMRRLIIPFILLFSLVSCTKKDQNYEELLLPSYTPEYATGFVIYGLEGYKSSIIRITNPWQGAKDVVMDTFIQRNDEEPPAGFVGQVVGAGAERIVALSTTNIGMLEYLGEVERIVGVSGLKYVFSDYLTDPANGIKDLGENIQYETLVSLRPDVIFCYGVADAQQTMTDKLEELKVPYMYVGAYLEEHPLGKSEWLMIFAEVLDMHDEAIPLFQKIVDDYSVVRALAEGVPIEERPKVMLNMPFNDAWVLPSSQSTTAQLIRDAGAVPFTGSDERGIVKNIGMEEAFTLLAEADYWVGLGQAIRYQDIPQSIRVHADKVKPIRENRLYNSNAIRTEGGGSAYFQEGIVRPDLLLRDLVEIFHPELQEHTLYFYHQIEVQ